MDQISILTLSVRGAETTIRSGIVCESNATRQPRQDMIVRCNILSHARQIMWPARLLHFLDLYRHLSEMLHDRSQFTKSPA